MSEERKKWLVTRPAALPPLAWFQVVLRGYSENNSDTHVKLVQAESMDVVEVALTVLGLKMERSLSGRLDFTDIPDVYRRGSPDLYIASGLLRDGSVGHLAISLSAKNAELELLRKTCVTNAETIKDFGGKYTEACLEVEAGKKKLAEKNEELRRKEEDLKRKDEELSRKEAELKSKDEQCTVAIRAVELLAREVKHLREENTELKSAKVQQAPAGTRDPEEKQEEPDKIRFDPESMFRWKEAPAAPEEPAAPAEPEVQKPLNFELVEPDKIRFDLGSMFRTDLWAYNATEAHDVGIPAWAEGEITPKLYPWVYDPRCTLTAKQQTRTDFVPLFPARLENALRSFLGVNRDNPSGYIEEVKRSYAHVDKEDARGYAEEVIKAAPYTELRKKLKHTPDVGAVSLTLFRAWYCGWKRNLTLQDAIFSYVSEHPALHQNCMENIDLFMQCTGGQRVWNLWKEAHSHTLSAQGPAQEPATEPATEPTQDTVTSVTESTVTSAGNTTPGTAGGLTVTAGSDEDSTDTLLHVEPERLTEKEESALSYLSDKRAENTLLKLAEEARKQREHSKRHTEGSTAPGTDKVEADTQKHTDITVGEAAEKAENGTSISNCVRYKGANTDGGAETTLKQDELQLDDVRLLNLRKVASMLGIPYRRLQYLADQYTSEMPLQWIARRSDKREDCGTQRKGLRYILEKDLDVVRRIDGRTRKLAPPASATSGTPGSPA